MNERYDELLQGLERLLYLHNEVFNPDKPGVHRNNWQVAWPEEYRVIRSSLMQIKEAE